MLDDHALSKFWRAICNGEVEEKDHCLKFKNNKISWDVELDLSILLERGGYVDIYKMLITGQYKKMLILGTPGIGKSLLQMYLMYRLVKDAKDTQKGIPTFIYRNKDKKSYYFHSDGTAHIVKRLDELSEVKPDYYFSDTHTCGTADVNVCMVHATSIGNDSYEAFEKTVIGLAGQTPPCWTSATSKCVQL